MAVSLCVCVWGEHSLHRAQCSPRFRASPGGLGPAGRGEGGACTSHSYLQALAPAVCAPRTLLGGPACSPVSVSFPARLSGRVLGGWAQGVTCSEGGGGFAEGSGEDPLTTVIRLQRCGEEPVLKPFSAQGCPWQGGGPRRGPCRARGLLGTCEHCPWPQDTPRTLSDRHPSVGVLGSSETPGRPAGPSGPPLACAAGCHFGRGRALPLKRVTPSVRFGGGEVGSHQRESGGGLAAFWSLRRGHSSKLGSGLAPPAPLSQLPLLWARARCRPEGIPQPTWPTFLGPARAWGGRGRRECPAMVPATLKRF